MRNTIASLVVGGLMLLGAVLFIGVLSAVFEARTVAQHPIDDNYRPCAPAPQQAGRSGPEQTRRNTDC